MRGTKVSYLQHGFILRRDININLTPEVPVGRAKRTPTSVSLLGYRVYENVISLADSP